MNATLEKQGYKYTEEFGYIPEDWEVTALGDNINYFKGYAFKSSSYTQDGTRIIRVSDMSYDDISDSEQIFISKLEANELSKYALKENDVIITTVGSKPPVYTSLVGRAIQVKQKDDGSLLNQNAVCLRTKNKLKQRFLFYIFKQKYYMEFLEQIIRGNANQGSITLENLFELPVLCPPVEEQEKIAEVLGDVDSLIDKTQQLINKKKDLKTATMQKLLTPKDDWKEKKFKDIADMNSGGTPTSSNTSYYGGNIPFLSINDLTEQGKYLRKTEKTITELGLNNSSARIVKKGELLYAMYATLGKCSIACINVAISQAILGISVNYKIINNEYLYYYLTYIEDKVKNMGQTGTQSNLSKQLISEFLIPCPSIIEQERITTILSDMDSEIEALEQELNKYKDLKTGIMQQLLTGKIRLTDKEVKSDNKVVEITSVKPKRTATDEFKDAVIISMLAYKFGSEKYPLGAFRRQKLSYLFKRHNNIPIDEYMKKAMGPYNPKMKYQGAEGIALRNRYVRNVDRGLVATNSISKAEEYYNRYYQQESLSWLDRNFHYESNNNLEVLTTVDYAIVDLRNQNKEITLENIKSYIAGDEEWKPKLDKDFFTDEAITKAMQTSKTLLNSY